MSVCPNCGTDECRDCVQQPDRPVVEGEAWKAVAIALMARLTNEVSDPYCEAVIAYNHARNGRFDDALEWSHGAIK